MNLRHRIAKLELPGPSSATIRAAMIQLRETGSAPATPAGDYARLAEEMHDAMRASVPGPPGAAQ